MRFGREELGIVLRNVLLRCLALCYGMYSGDAWHCVAECIAAVLGMRIALKI
jgi:hypothetical protein